jgi:predicted acylesterase/phospholipase RssA
MPCETLDRPSFCPGGCGYAAYEVGVLEALFGPGSVLDAAIFTGTPAGAFNAAMMVSQPQAGMAETLEYLKDLWLNHISLDKAACRQGAVRYRGDYF